MDDNYFNFPIVLLQGFMSDSRKCLYDVFSYCVFDFMQNNSEDEMKEFFGISKYNKNRVLQYGKQLYDSINNEAFTGLSVSLFWQFYNEYKTDMDKITLLAYLAIKSIVGKRPFAKVTNQNLIYSRMAGYTHIQGALPEEILAYCTRRKFENIKTDLKEYYNVSFYAYYTRGRYISTQLDFETLCKVAEKQRLTNRMRQQKLAEKEARERIRNDTSIMYT